ncbi:2-oxoacid dehydrogenases acyltransferase-domain-containing protein [Rhodocollybia butyracea]|uniref:Dihydrolipoamide acetyltransferase component of pyruvate dehydrogenase complex n=1 Tax=Rhodocollybia butyracea TaxID=206335 RepID=A0A9P5U857_9AGAR|nr:2-oxoacid dehydrogenases acyltransferase-domain-containing protein [Rhodocollybia butyracea]
MLLVSRRLQQHLAGKRFLVACLHTSRRVQNSRKVIEQFKLADIGEGITECELIKWNVKPNDMIQAFDPLCEVQSDKASVEITSPFDGVVAKLLVQEGEVAKVGSNLCLIEVMKEIADSVDTSVAEPLNTDTLPIESFETPTSTVSSEENTEEPLPSSTTVRRKHPMDPTFTPEVDGPGHDAPVLATPSVRHFARQNGVDLSQLVPGSGRDGRIDRRDVEQYLSAGASASTQHPTRVEAHGQTENVVVELSRTRYGMWKAMEKSLQIPHFGYSTTLDLTALHGLLPTLNANIPPHFLPESSAPALLPVSPLSVYTPPPPPETPLSGKYTRLTYLPFLLKTLAKSMIEWPLFRASITLNSTSKPTLTIRPHSDINVALSTPTGLYTPTLQSADTYSMYALSSQLKHLSHLGRQIPCGLTPKEMPKQGGTVSLSNVGAIGAGDFAAPVLVPGGGVAIVALGRAKWVWDVDRGDGSGERRLKMGISWTADHRVVEGAELAAFVECWRGYVESPERLIADSV